MYRKIALITVALAVSTACTSQITGNEGNFQFSYPADDRPLDFNKPVAVGAFLDLEVRDVGAREPVDVQSASFDDPAILAVDDIVDHVITLEGTGDGNALLTVEGTTADDQTLTDSVNMLARVPEVHELSHTCGPDDATEGTYLTDQRVWVPYELEMSNGQPVIGYGYYPVSVDPDTAMSVVPEASGQQFMALDVGTTAGTVTLTSDLDGTALDFEVVAPGAIDGIAEPTAYVLEDIDVGDTNPFYVLPKVGDGLVCQADTPIQVASDTPSICEASVIEQPGTTTGDDSYRYGWFEIEGLAEGDCQYTVTYPEGSDGAGTSAQFTYPIEP